VLTGLATNAQNTARCEMTSPGACSVPRIASMALCLYALSARRPNAACGCETYRLAITPRTQTNITGRHGRGTSTSSFVALFNEI